MEGAERIEGETSALYERINQFCQEQANASGKRVVYRFKTQYVQLARWALSKGAEIFHWDTVGNFEDREGDGKILDDTEEFTASKGYQPQG